MFYFFVLLFALQLALRFALLVGQAAVHGADLPTLRIVDPLTLQAADDTAENVAVHGADPLAVRCPALLKLHEAALLETKKIRTLVWTMTPGICATGPS